jgi:benzylsuccinate CoA-transferase BbsF subunit
MISLLGPAVLDWTVNGRNQMPRGNLSDSAAPHGVYACAGDDRWIALSASTDTQWRALAAELGRPELASDERFATLVDRHRNHAALDAEITACTRQRDPFELMQALQQRGVPAGVAQTAQDLLERDPQLRCREHFAILDHPEVGPSVYNAPPFRLCSVAEPIMRTPAPLLGQHTREVCTDLLGMTDEQIDRLVAEDVLV